MNIRDSIEFVFPTGIIEKLKTRAQPKSWLRYRLDVIEAHGPRTNDPFERRRWANLKKRCSAWKAYFDAAADVGLFEGAHGNDLLARLRSPKDDNFRGAVAECMTALVVTQKLNRSVSPRPAGKVGRILELSIADPTGDINVEVKAPFREMVEGVNYGDDDDLLRQSLESANDQFKQGSRNLLVLCPQIRFPIYADRGQLTKAFYAEEVISHLIDIKTRTVEGGPILGTKSSGHFLKWWRGEKNPRYTRTSGILVIEEDHNDQQITWHVLLLNNPNASFPLPDSFGKEVPRFAVVGDQIKWTDGARVFR